MKEVLFFFAVAICCVSAQQTKPCRAVKAEYGTDCECTEDYCDTMNFLNPEEKGQFVIVTSSKDGDRFDSRNGSFASGSGSSGANTLSIDQSMKYPLSQIIGFGGIWSGAVREILEKLPPKLKEHVYQSYFDPDIGIGYNMLRLQIGGSIFDLEPWTEDDASDPDPKLTQFTELDSRSKTMNKQIKEMIQLTKNSQILKTGLAWSAPLWMKANQEWYGKSDNQLIKDYYQSYADYLARWVNFTAADGIKISGMSTGNEPRTAEIYPCGAEGMSWKPKDQAEFMMDYLVPALDKTGLGINISVFDDMRPMAIPYLKEMTEERPELMEIADHIGIHPFLDSVSSPKILDTLHQTYRKPILNSEMSFGFLDNPPIAFGSWERGVELINVVMENLQHNVAGFIDWNIILDPDGGPSYAGAKFNAFIHTNKNFTAFYKQPLFYAMGQFAKFIHRDSLRIDHKFSGSDAGSIQALAYLRPDKRVAVIVYNNGTDPVDVTLNDPMIGMAKLSFKPKSLSSIIYLSK